MKFSDGIIHRYKHMDGHIGQFRLYCTCGAFWTRETHEQVMLSLQGHLDYYKGWGREIQEP